MKLRTTLIALANIIAREAERNDDFRQRLESALSLKPAGPHAEDGNKRRKGGRRAPAVLDPVEVIRLGEYELRQKLAALDIEQLRDIVAQHGMDPGKLVMKWKDADRVIGRIIELSLARSKKGDAFRTE